MVGKVHKRKAYSEANGTDKANESQNVVEKSSANEKTSDDEGDHGEHTAKVSAKTDVSDAENGGDELSVGLSKEANVSKSKKRKYNKNDKLISKTSNIEDKNRVAQKRNRKSTEDADHIHIAKEKRNKKSIIQESSANVAETTETVTTEGSDIGGDEDKEYEVEDIIDHKIKNGASYFLIRWKGYSKESDTWEPEKTLNCTEIIERYRKKEENKMKKAQKPMKKMKKGKRSGSIIDKKSINNKKKATADANKEWEVDKIIDYGDNKNGRLFRIRWKGFSSKYDTWEPEENLQCSDIIEKFMARMKSQENLTFKELREKPKKTKRLVNETTNIGRVPERKSKRSSNKQRVFYDYMDEE